jgi:hypothetical protein
LQAAQLVGTRWCALWKLAALSGAGMLALALATPARADEQAPPPPLMLASTAVIPPDEPEMAVPVAAPAPAPESAPAPAPDPAPVRVVAAPGWKLAAKARVVHHSAPVRVQQSIPRPVISTPSRPVHAARPHHAAKRVRAARTPTRTGWYQVTPAQYRGTWADSPGGHQSLGAPVTSRPAVDRVLPRPARPQKVRTICELRLRKCLQFCSWIATDNASQNERWIGACISTPDPGSRLDRLHELLLQRLWNVALEDRQTLSERQYQHAGTQYQTAAPSFGWQLAAARSTPGASERRRAARPVATPLLRAAPRRHALVLAASITHRNRAPKSVQRPSREAREAGPAARASASSDWLVPSLAALIGAVLLALLLSAGTVLPGVGTVRTRLRSRGLTSSSIDLGREAPRGRGISYRD